MLGVSKLFFSDISACKQCGQKVVLGDFVAFVVATVSMMVMALSCLYLLTQRTSQQQETRLHNKYSLGQGGHINDTDYRVHAGNGDRGPILNGLMREIEEEFTLTSVQECLPVALINDNSSEVSRVHIGIVYTLRVGSLNFKVAEQGKHTAQWATKTALPLFYEGMEQWSKLVYDQLIA